MAKNLYSLAILSAKNSRRKGEEGTKRFLAWICGCVWLLCGGAHDDCVIVGARTKLSKGTVPKVASKDSPPSGYLTYNAPQEFKLLFCSLAHKKSCCACNSCCCYTRRYLSED